MATDVITNSKQLPERIGRYAVQRLIARGGMGSVYLARMEGEQGFGKWVAVKTVFAHSLDDEQFLEGFANEARLCARIDHPNVCQVFDFGVDDGTPFLAMEFLDGRPVSDILATCAQRAETLPRSIAARIIADAARGLHAAHELRTESGEDAQVVHRDVSPQNLFVLFSGITKVVDFGIARSVERTTEKTEMGLVKGKLAYMAPEQAQEKPLDRRADVFALGAVLWELLTGQRLFRAPNDAATLKAVLFDPIEKPSTVRAAIPPSLDEIVMRALARNPDERFATAERMARDLEQWIAREAGGAGVSEVAAFLGYLFEDARTTDQLRLHESRVPSKTTELPTTAIAAKRAPVEKRTVESTPARPAAALLDTPAAQAPLPPLPPPYLPAPGPAAPRVEPALVGDRDGGDWRAEFRAPAPPTAPAASGPAFAAAKAPTSGLAALPDKYGTRGGIVPVKIRSGPGLGTALVALLLLVVAASLTGIFPAGQRAIASALGAVVGPQRAASLLSAGPRAGTDSATAEGSGGSARIHFYSGDPSEATPESAVGQPRVVRSRANTGGRALLTDDDSVATPMPARPTPRAPARPAGPR